MRKTQKYHYYVIHRETIEGYYNSFAFITFEKLISKQSFVSDRTTDILFSKIHLRVIGYDTEGHQIYQPSLPKVHKQ